MKRRKITMRLLKLIAFFMVLTYFGLFCSRSSPKNYPIQPINFTRVKITDNFWKPRLETNRTVTIPYAFKMNEETGRLNNLRKAAGLLEGPYIGRRFNDSDVYKAMEGAAYSLAMHPDASLEETLDEIITIIAAAQEEDGYIYAARTVDPENPAPGAGNRRWIHLPGSHELYNAGHLYEAAVAHFQTTGKRTFLDIAIKNANLLLSVFGPDKKLDTSGHQEIEIGLPKLFRITRKSAYLDLAKFFLDQRGQPHDSEPYPDDSVYSIYNGREYRQDHIPILKQTEAVGHAVRAAYMYAGMADVAALTGNIAYIHAIDRIWEDVTEKKLYLTGGIGARHTSEAFGDAYELPNREAYNETCAAIGNVLWNHRMFLLHGEGKYIDVLERTLYNGLLSGVSLSGDRFFYQNPLESTGGYERSPWFEVSCCPANIARFLPSLPGYIYAQKEGTLYVNLFITNTADIILKDMPLQIRQETSYPWDGQIQITVKPEKPFDFILYVRIPGWAQSQPVPGDLYRYEPSETNPIKLKINGQATRLDLRQGYARIDRLWSSEDVVDIILPMPVRQVVAHEAVAENLGKIAFERGPIVYCAEEADNGKVLDLNIENRKTWTHHFLPGLLGGLTVLEGTANRSSQSVQITMIPYYSWAHRGAGEMAVWMRRSSGPLKK
jgi:DUF1680 family protein